MTVYCAAETVGKDRIPGDSASTQGALLFSPMLFSTAAHLVLFYSLATQSAAQNPLAQTLHGRLVTKAESGDPTQTYSTPGKL